MKNRTIGLLGRGAGAVAFATLCALLPAPAANAAEGDPVVVMINPPTQTCIAGEANDEISDPVIVSGGEAIEIAPPQWSMPDADGVSTKIIEVYSALEGPDWVFAPDSWKGDTFYDYGGPCGGETEVIIIPIPSAPATTPDDFTKEGDVKWLPEADTVDAVWSYNDKGELLLTATEGREFTDGSTVHNYGLPPDVYNPPTDDPGTDPDDDPVTPPDNGGGTGGDDNGSGGNTPPAGNSGGDNTGGNTGGGASTPDTSNDGKTSVDTSKGDDKQNNTGTNQVRRPGHNGAVVTDDTSSSLLGWSAASAFALMMAAGVMRARRKRVNIN